MNEILRKENEYKKEDEYGKEDEYRKELVWKGG